MRGPVWGGDVQVKLINCAAEVWHRTKKETVHPYIRQGEHANDREHNMMAKQIDKASKEICA